MGVLTYLVFFDLSYLTWVKKQREFRSFLEDMKIRRFDFGFFRKISLKFWSLDPDYGKNEIDLAGITIF